MILGVLAGLVVPTYKNYTDNAYKKIVNVTAKSIAEVLDLCLSLKGLDRCDSFKKLSVKCDVMKPTYDSSWDGKSYSPTSSDQGLFCSAKKVRGKVCIQLYHVNREDWSACVDGEKNIHLTDGKDGSNHGECGSSSAVCG